MTKTQLAIIAGAAMFTSMASAQQVVTTTMGPEPQIFEFKMLGAEGFGPGKVVTGMPFSAEETNTNTQMLADGNRIVNTSTSKVYRDQQGRTRTENTLGNIGGVPASEAGVTIMIDDPVSGSHYILNPAERTAVKMGAMQQFSVKDGAAMMMHMKLADEADAKAKVRTEAGGAVNYVYSSRRTVEKTGKTDDLGTQNMEGVLVKGTRSTMTIPAGSMGNDRDINVVTERWYSPDLQMNIMTKRSDPRMGESVFQVTNLSRSNPDPSLFAPPADYQIKENPKGAAMGKMVTIQK
jgi:hypothetical protein